MRPLPQDFFLNVSFTDLGPESEFHLHNPLLGDKRYYGLCFTEKKPEAGSEGPCDFALASQLERFATQLVTLACLVSPEPPGLQDFSAWENRYSPARAMLWLVPSSGG